MVTVCASCVRFLFSYEHKSRSDQHYVCKKQKKKTNKHNVSRLIRKQCLTAGVSDQFFWSSMDGLFSLSFVLSFRSQALVYFWPGHTDTTRRPWSEANLPGLSFTCSHSPVKLTGVVSEENIHAAARAEVLTQYGHLGSSRNRSSGRGQCRHTWALCCEISHTWSV